MRDAFIAELTDLASIDKDVVLITGDLGFGVFDDFAETHKHQFINAGVAEQNMTGIACGMAMEGCKVYTYSIGNFNTLRPFEQIRNDICYHDANVTVVSVGAGFSYGQLGMSHFATEDIAVMRALPNMSIVCPADPWETTELVRQMYTQSGPKYLRLDKGSAGIAPDPNNVLLGKSRIVKPGKDLTIIATGSILGDALIAAGLLDQHGWSCRVVAVHSLKPFDDEVVLESIRDTNIIFSVEEHSMIGGLGSIVADAFIEANFYPKLFSKFGLKDEFPSVVGDQQYLRKHVGLDGKSLFTRIKDKLNEK